MSLLPRSLSARLALILVAGLLLVQLLSSLLLFRDRTAMMEERFGIQLVQRIQSIVTLLNHLPDDQHPLVLESLNSRLLRVSIGDRPLTEAVQGMPARHLQQRLQHVLASDHRIVVSLHQRPLLNNPPPPRLGMPIHMEPVQRGWQHNRRPPTTFEISIELRPGRWLRIQRQLPADTTEWPVRLLIYLALLLVSVGLLTLYAVRQVTRPLKQLASTADALGRDVNRPAMEESGPSEVREAARAFNTMQQRLKRYLQDRDQLLTAVSHDLKTPLTRLRLRSEMLEERPVAEKIGADIDEMERMIGATLDYMRGEASKERSVDIDINALLCSLQDDMQETLGNMVYDPVNCAPFPGRPLAIKRCLQNLVTNAIRYGKEARVSLQDRPEELLIQVRDRGEQRFSVEELQQFFTPFFRRDHARSGEGNGLGLGIARNIARAHGGELLLEPAESGGVVATIRLPRH